MVRDGDNMELVEGIASAFASSRELEGVAWVEVAAVFYFDDDGELNQTCGYAYDASDDYTAFAPEIDDFADSTGRYRDWLREGEKGFTSMLFQFNRETLRYNADFDYDPDSSRWRVTPANLDGMIEGLRPRLGTPSNGGIGGGDDESGGADEASKTLFLRKHPDDKRYGVDPATRNI